MYLNTELYDRSLFVDNPEMYDIHTYGVHMYISTIEPILYPSYRTNQPKSWDNKNKKKVTLPSTKACARIAGTGPSPVIGPSMSVLRNIYVSHLTLHCLAFAFAFAFASHCIAR